MNLRQKVAKGVLWSFIQRWSTQLISFFVFLVLARLLDPEAFGLVALASVFTAFVQPFVDSGFAEAIVQRSEIEQRDLDTAFWTSVLIGGLMTVGGIAASGLVAELFHEPRLALIVRWLSLSFVLAALSSTQRAILQRELAFKSLAMRSLMAISAGGIVGVTMAALGFGVWSLVAQNLVKGLVGAVVLWTVSDWRPGLNFSKEHFKELFAFGINIVGIKVLDFFNFRSAHFFIGYFLGPVPLGYYTVARRLSQTVIGLLTGAANAVAFPAFSRLQNDSERMRRAFYTSTRYMNAIAMPCFIGMVLVAPELVPALYGPKWTPSIPVMQVLAFVGILQSVTFCNGSVIKAAGKPSWAMGVTFLYAITVVPAVMLVARWGIVAVAIAYVARAYLLSPIGLWLVRKLIRIKVSTYLRQFVVSLVGSLVMVFAVLGTKRVFSDMIGLHALLVIEILFGAMVYAVTVALIAPTFFQQALDLARMAVLIVSRRKVHISSSS